MAESKARLLGDQDSLLLSRIEDAGLNASAPPQQRWFDGWLLRLSPGKAQRARCINAVAAGRLPLVEKLQQCGELFASRDLPLLVRVTPFTQPENLDAELESLGYGLHDETRVMVRSRIVPAAVPAPGPDLEWAELGAAEFAATAAGLRGSSVAECAAHAERLCHAPVPYRGFVLREAGGGAIKACGQIASESNFVGLYDVVTEPSQRRKGYGRVLCQYMLTLANSSGIYVAYLQVGADNEAARRMYRGLGFVDAYSYHYRRAAP